VAKPSPIAGTGLFTDRPYRRGDFLIYYSGTILNDPTAEGNRMLQISPNRFIDGDGACRVSEARGDLANHAAGKWQGANARFRVDGRHPKWCCMVYIEAMIDIDQGTEILVDYGPQFRFD
jgi:hypothetical protein